MSTKSASGRSRTTASKAKLISLLVLALRTWISNPPARAADCASLNVVSKLGPVGLASTATRVAVGTSSRTSPNRFATNSALKKLIPVRLPPGRARLATRPILTGSSAKRKTIGIVEVAALAASAPLARVAITVTWRRTKSAANSPAMPVVGSTEASGTPVRHTYGEDDEVLRTIAFGGAAWRNKPLSGAGNRGDTRHHVGGQNRGGYLRPSD